MKTTVLAGLAGSLVLAGAAQADFLGWGAVNYVLDADGNAFDITPWDGVSAVWSVIDVYATFSAPTVVVNVFNGQISANKNFHHDDLNTNLFGGAGTWAPNSFAPGIGNPAIDSFVALNVFGVGQGGFLGADPNWGPEGFDQQNIPNLAGWFNQNPPNQAGATSAQGGFEHAVFVGRFVLSAIPTEENPSLVGVLNFTAAMTASFGNATDSQHFEYLKIPAPGALALLGLAGLAGSRRRRA